MQTLLDRLIHQLIELVTELVFQRVPACTAVDEERLKARRTRESPKDPRCAVAIALFALRA
jgi:hypothetical protein